MHPSDLKSFRVFLEAIRAELISLRLQIQEHNRGARESSKAQEDKQEAIASAIVRLREPDNQRIQNQGAEERRHSEILREQRNLKRWTAAAFAAAAIYAGLAFLQWVTMQKTYREMQWQTYDACLNAQAAQDTFIQVQGSSKDSHTATAAAVQQVAAEIESERAFLNVETRPPASGEYTRTTAISIPTLGIPIKVENGGKSEAHFTLSLRGILLEKGDKFEISKSPERVLRAEILAGGRIPENTEPGASYAHMTLMVPVEDVNGETVPYKSPASNDFLNGIAEVMVYGKLDYTDNWGHYTKSLCYMVYTVKAGASRAPSTPDEIKCGEYNREQKQYINEPSIAKPAAEKNIELVKCTPPVN
jgi:hypothetical protein